MVPKLRSHAATARRSEESEADGVSGRTVRLPTELLQPGDCWCLCAARWKQALEAGVAPKIRLAATEESALEFATLEELSDHALDLQ
jgi:uncharacterized protein (DUF2237 family)